MRAVIQRVKFSTLSIDNQEFSKIRQGLCVLLGVGHNDDKKTAEFLAEKCVNLRIFEDENQKMNLSLIDIDGDALIVSQFTLFADCKKGRRPSFTDAAKPDVANELYEYFVQCVRNQGIKNVETGVFGADMQVNILNDGPVTICLDTDIIMK